MNNPEIVKAIDHFLFHSEPTIISHNDPVSRSEYLKFVNEVRELLKAVREALKN